MSPPTRRLQKEASELLTTQASPSIHAAPVADNLFDWHFTIAGPPAPSPYAGGLYHGRIVLPAAYPLRPPSFRFLTPSGRFEINREICLSISGHHEESWQPAWGIRTALLAIRSYMDAEANGQVGGLDVSGEARREYARLSRGWACEACGESNERVMEGWREVCRDAGKCDDGDEDRDDTGQKDQTAGPAPTPEATAEPTTSAAPTSAPQPPRQCDTSGPSAARQERPVTPRPQGQSSDGQWLDRAIIGVLLALVFMILRSFANVDD
ncbi:ubiquitin conjugating enzyme [Aspergillus sp. HF37]|nr:ubiquitin conjugating enzyme [Aspergillus sp. HF37]